MNFPLAAYSHRLRHGANPITFLPNFTQAQLERNKAEFKRNSTKIKRAILKLPEGRKYIPVDAQGVPVWDEAKNGQFVVIVVKIHKGDGLTEVEDFKF
jgi:hypothetical protein